jgi:hypothetical protein
MTRRLMSRKDLDRWFRGHHTSPTLYRENLLEAKLRPLSKKVALEFDEICSAHGLDGERRMLLLVGTLLVRKSRKRLWRKIYRAQAEVVHKGDERRFLEELTSAARRREL